MIKKVANLILRYLPKSLKRYLFFQLSEGIQSIHINAHNSVGERFGKSFKEFFITEDMPSKIKAIKANLDDDESVRVIDQKLEHLLQLPAWGTKYAVNTRCLSREEVLYTKEQILENVRFKSVLPKIKNELFLKTYIPEVVFYHHGLTLLPECITNNLNGKVFVDCGASYGDSAAMFDKYYNPQHVISFELTNNPSNAISDYNRTLRENNLSLEKFTLVTQGVDRQSWQTDDGYKFITIDSRLAECEDIGLIKMDIEGAALNAIYGAKRTICKNSPLLIISVYHCPEEFFEIKPLLESFGLGYKFIYRNLNFFHHYELETVLIAWV